MADSTVLVLVPESGDGIQTLKSGIMEIADLFVVNKADRPGADKLRQEIEVTLGIRNGNAFRHVPAHHGGQARSAAETAGAAAASDAEWKHAGARRPSPSRARASASWSRHSTRTATGSPLGQLRERRRRRLARAHPRGRGPGAGPLGLGGDAPRSRHPGGSRRPERGRVSPYELAGDAIA